MRRADVAPVRHGANLVSLLLWCAAPNARAYKDPAAKTHDARRGFKGACAVNGSNHRNYPGSTVLPPPSANSFQVHEWVQQYAAALAAQPTDISALRRLKASAASDDAAASFSLPSQYDQKWFDFVQVKLKMLDALENRMKAHRLWNPGRSLLDVGGGHGMLAAYLMARHKMNVTVFDVASSYQCEEILSSPLKVHFFDGKTLPMPNKAVDAVSFMSVLHHAGASTESLLKEAARVARRWIVVLEDTQTKSAMTRNKEHDPRGVFRTDAHWKWLFERALPGFRLVRDGYTGAQLASRHKGESFSVGIQGDERRCFSKWYLLESSRSSKAREHHGGSGASAVETLPPTLDAKYVDGKCVPDVVRPHTEGSA